MTQFYDLHVKIGKEAVRRCGDVIDHQGKCDGVLWLFRRQFLPGKDQQLNRGRIIKNPEDKSYRLSVTEDCSLVIKKVTFDDTGFYTCLKPGQDEEYLAELIVFTSEYLHHNVFTLK